MSASSAFAIPNGHTFALYALDPALVDRNFASPYRIADSAWVFTTPPITPDDWWKEELGKSEVREYEGAALFLLVHDARHDEAVASLDALLYALHVQRAGRFGSGHFFQGVNSRVQSHSWIPAHYAHHGLDHPEVTPTLLGETAIIFESLRRVLHVDPLAASFARIGVGAQPHSRLRRGFGSFVRGIRDAYDLDRLHAFVRAIEAVILPPTGETTKKFVHRCNLLADRSDEARTALHEIYELRSRVEHVHEWKPILAHHRNPDRVVAIRAAQAEVLASEVYRRILTTPALQAEFVDDATTATFWRLGDDEVIQRWGAPVRITEKVLSERGILRVPV